MTLRELLDSLERIAAKEGLDPATTEVELDLEPNGPILAVGHSVRFDGVKSFLISPHEYDLEKLQFIGFCEGCGNEAAVFSGTKAKCDACAPAPQAQPAPRPSPSSATEPDGDCRCAKSEQAGK